MITMLLGGLWHGASWNFVIWGGIHGSWLSLERRAGGWSTFWALPRALKVAATFVVVLVTWVFFRAPTLNAAAVYLQSMAGWARPEPRQLIATGLIWQRYYVATMLIAGAVVWTCPQSWDLTRHLTWPRAALCVAVLWIAVAVLFTQSYNPFIYYIF